MVYSLDTLDYWTYVSLEAYWRHLVLEAIHASEVLKTGLTEDSQTEITDPGYSSC
jgi:hypothetical protein